MVKSNSDKTICSARRILIGTPEESLKIIRPESKTGFFFFFCAVSVLKEKTNADSNVHNALLRFKRNAKEKTSSNC